MSLLMGDLGSGELWATRADDLEAVFASHQARGGPYFVPASEGGNSKGDYWALTRHADIAEVSRRPQEFSSAAGTTVDDVPPAMLGKAASFLAMDDPHHTRLRRIVSRAFTPGALNRLKSDVEAVAAEVVGAIRERGSCDFVEDVAAPIPTRVIANLMGIPREEEKPIVANANRLLGAYEPEYVPDQTDEGRAKARLGAIEYFTNLANELGKDRMSQPRQDLVTMLMTEGVEGEKMEADELAPFFILLITAGNETTRNAIAHGMLALSQYPEQRALWQRQFDELAPRAVEEVLRWATPILHMRRTVTADDVRLGDVTVKKGDKVVMWYYAANRDPETYADPATFDVTRRPNDHFSFGAPGPHFCLGAHLARREITVAFRELFEQVPDIRVAGEPAFLNSPFLNGVKRLPVTFTAA